MSKLKTRKAFSDNFSKIYFPRVDGTRDAYGETMIELNTKYFGKENLCKECKGTTCKPCEFTGLSKPSLILSLPWDD